MTRRYRIRIVSTLIVLLFAAAIPLSKQLSLPVLPTPTTPTAPTVKTAPMKKLATLDVKGRAPKTGYARDQFGDGWQEKNGCDTRNIILARDLQDIVTNSKCQVVSGTLDDPYTGKTIHFLRGPTTSDDVQIDHVVALSDAWQTGAQYLSFTTRETLANDPLELLAVDGPANEKKSDGDAASWLPPNKAFRCQYVSRQIDVKAKYKLWVTPAEKAAMQRVLGSCL